MKRGAKKLPFIFIGVLFIVGFVPFILITFEGRSLWGILVDLGSLTRPLWESKPFAPSKIYPNFSPSFSDNPTINSSQLCYFHGWKPYLNKTSQRRIFDAVIYNGEIDLLELRIRELWNVVDRFVVLEGNVTFSGKNKPYYFEMQKERLKFAESKLFYFKVSPKDGLKLGNDFKTDDFANEITSRHLMGTALVSAGIQNGDVFLTNDVDEIPSELTLSLWKHCYGQPKKMHLILQTFLYSFEFPLPYEPNWRPLITILHNSRFSFSVSFICISFTLHHLKPQIVFKINRPSYCRGCVNENALDEAGWHCSWCFKSIEEFKIKMHSYTHSDRAKRFKNSDSNQSIQNAVCSGKDIFGMLPESHSFSELYARLKLPKKRSSAMNLPSSIFRFPDKFNFLLPGNCIRQ